MKLEQLEKLNIHFKAHFAEYYGREIPLVFGNGNVDSDIVLVGEAPGKHEVEQGKPFVGQAGKNLEEFISILEIKREDLYITNIVKFRPYKISEETGRESNRTPTKEEINISTDYIKQELSIIKPKLVVSLGNTALKCILGDDKVSIGVLHGSPLNINFGEVSFVLFPLYHPASIIYRRELKSVYLEDLQKLRQYLRAAVDMDL